MQRRLILGLMMLALAPAAAHADSAEWALDTSHSRFGFSISHMVVSSVSGRFKQASGKFLIDDANLTKSAAELTLKVDSIDTDDAKRDEHLRSPDFFDSKKFPNLTFKSTKIAKAGAGYKVTGDLTIRDVTKPVTLNATISKSVTNPWGKQVRAIKATGSIKRSDFGIKWNKTLDAGGVVLGEDVALDLQIELNK